MGGGERGSSDIMYATSHVSSGSTWPSLLGALRVVIQEIYAECVNSVCTVCTVCGSLTETIGMAGWERQFLIWEALRYLWVKENTIHTFFLRVRSGYSNKLRFLEEIYIYTYHNHDSLILLLIANVWWHFTLVKAVQSVKKCTGRLHISPIIFPIKNSTV